MANQTVGKLTGEIELGHSVASAAEASAFLDKQLIQTHPPKNRLDFGGPETYTLHLRRIGYSIGDCDLSYECGTPFAIFGGRQESHGGKWIVILKNVQSWTLMES